LGIPRLADQQPRACTGGQVGRDRQDEDLVAVVEHRLARRSERTTAPQTAPRVRSAAIISWSPPMVMFICQLGLDEGSPPVASCRVEIPDFERTTSAIWLTSSP
jgi:hypothetical protein